MALAAYRMYDLVTALFVVAVGGIFGYSILRSERNK